MEYRQLGRTGLRVSTVGLGCGNFGGIGSGPRFVGKGDDERTAFALLDAAVEHGLNFLDTANAYGDGESERILGRWLKTKSASVRQNLLLSSKAFNPVNDDPNGWGLSRRHLKQQVEASLKRLGVERLDLFLIHEPDSTTPLEETLQALDDLVRQGMIHYLGASNIEAWRMMKAAGIAERRHIARFDFVQNNYSLLFRDAERELLPLCREEGIGFTPFSPLAGGWLAGRYRRAGDYPAGSRMTLRPEPYRELEREQTFTRIDAFEKKSAEFGLPMATLAMAWVLAHPQTSAIISGPRRLDHLDLAVQASGVSLSQGDRETIASIFT